MLLGRLSAHWRRAKQMNMPSGKESRLRLDRDKGRPSWQPLSFRAVAECQRDKSETRQGVSVPDLSGGRQLTVIFLPPAIVESQRIVTALGEIAMPSPKYHREQAKILAGLALSTKDTSKAEQFNVAALEHLARAESADGADVGPPLDETNNSGDSA